MGTTQGQKSFPHFLTLLRTFPDKVDAFSDFYPQDFSLNQGGFSSKRAKESNKNKREQKRTKENKRESEENQKRIRRESKRNNRLKL